MEWSWPVDVNYHEAGSTGSSALALFDADAFSDSQKVAVTKTKVRQSANCDDISGCSAVHALSQCDFFQLWSLPTEA